MPLPTSSPCTPANTRLLIGLAFVCCFALTAGAETYRVGPDDDWFALISGAGLEPGDEVILDGGVYSDERRLSLRHRGTADAPIVIRGADGKRAIFRRPNARQNTLNLEGTQHLVLRDFEITGGAAGIRISPREDVQPSDITLQGLHIHHIAGVAVTCNHTGGDYARMQFRENHIHHTGGHGEAFYLGGNNATAIFHDSVVERNYIHDLVGDQVSQGDGIEVKQGSYGNRIAGNVVHDTNYPGIIVYGTAGRARNEVTNNLIWNSGDNGIQAAADAVISGNCVAGARGAGVYSRLHQGAVPGNLVISDNLVVVRAPATALRIIEPSNSADGTGYSGPIEITDNTLVALGNAPIVRIDEREQIVLRGNRLIGAAEGPGGEAGGIPLDQLDRLLSKLEDHPAWQHLDRAEVPQRFSR